MSNKSKQLSDAVKELGESLKLKQQRILEKASLQGESLEQTAKRLEEEEKAKSKAEIINTPIDTLYTDATSEPIELLRQSQTLRKAPVGDEQADFFVPTLYDVGTRDSRCVMDVALFRLSKQDKRASKVIRHELSDGYIEVSSGPAGMATIWDYDLVLMAISHLTEAMNRYKKGKEEHKPSRVFRPHVGDVLKFCRKSDGGRQKSSLVDACLRLNTTHISMRRTKKTSNGRVITVSEGEPLISRYKVTENKNKRPEYLEIEIANWMYQEITEGKTPDVLTVHPDYFLIEPGIARFIYRLARRSAGKSQAKWLFQTLYERSGSTGEFKKFCFNIRKLINANDLPEYELKEEQGLAGLILTMENRDMVKPKEKESGSQ